MSSRRYAVTAAIRAEMEMGDEVFAQVDDDWRQQFYSFLQTDDEVAAHVGGAMLELDCPLTTLDGFANLDDSFVKVVRLEWESEAEKVE